MDNERLIFPIGFDLTSGIKEIKKGIPDNLKPIQDKLDKNPLKISLKFDTTNLDKLDKVKERLAQIKIQPFTSETKSSITELVKELSALEKILEKLNKYSTKQATTSSSSTDAVRAARIAEIEQKILNLKGKQREQTAKAELAEQKLANATAKQYNATKRLNNAYRSQSSYLERLIKRMAVYASFGAISGFISKVREVTAEFELQRVSLGAIIQDQQKAEQLFSQIKAFAQQSPLTILDLTKYTKQLAAYRIETDKLFDTTKRLADISVGLGVDFQRIVLFYGQVRARGALYSSELRQATEAGIPLVELLAKKYSQLNGELVTSADVLKMIENRQVSFEDVASIFEDMTDKGGMFYQMQEKQGNTLYGMWQKLGDAAAIMYDQIGNTESINNSMRATISIIRDLMLNWKRVGVIIGGVSAIYIAHIISSKNMALAEAVAAKTHLSSAAALRTKILALKQDYAATSKLNVVRRVQIASEIAATRATLRANAATNILTKSAYNLKAALLANPWTAIIAGLTVLVTWISTAGTAVDKLQSKFNDLELTYAKKATDLKSNFKKLANEALNQIDGSKKQKEALDELNRTYGEILGSENLQIESLRKLHGQYSELCDIIDVYTLKQKGSEQKAAITEAYSETIASAKSEMEDYLRSFGASEQEISEIQIRINEYIQSGLSGVEAAKKAIAEFDGNILAAAGNMANIFDLGKFKASWANRVRMFTHDALFNWGEFSGESVAGDYGRMLDAQEEALKKSDKAIQDEIYKMNEYVEQVDKLSEAMTNFDWTSQNAFKDTQKSYNSKNNTSNTVAYDNGYDPTKVSGLYDKFIEETNAKISAMFTEVDIIATQAGMTTAENFYKGMKSVSDGNKNLSLIDFDGLLKEISDPKAASAIKQIQEMYEAIAPSDNIIRAANYQLYQLAETFSVNGDSVQRYAMKTGETLEQHRERLKDEITRLLKVASMLNFIKTLPSAIDVSSDALNDQITDTEKIIKWLQADINKIPDIAAIGKKKKSGNKQDNRLQYLQESISLVGKLYKEYKDLNKLENDSSALSDMNRLYQKSLESLSKQYGIKLPQSVETYQEALKRLRDEMVKQMGTVKDANKKRTYEKALIELDYTIEKAGMDEAQRKIEAQIKELAERVSQTKTAKEFFDKVLNLTGDTTLAARVSLSFYDSTGDTLQKEMIEQIKAVFKSNNDKVKIDLSEAIDFKTNRVNYTKLMGIYNKYQEFIIEQNRNTAKKIAEEGVKTSAEQYIQWMKDLETAKSFSEKRIELARYTANQIAEINANPNLTDEEKSSLTKDYQEREAKKASELEYEAFKDSPMYVALFDDLNSASTRMLENMREKLMALKGEWKNLDPTQLKELQSRLNEIDSQLKTRNPFKELIRNIKQYKELSSEYGSKKSADKNVMQTDKAYQDALKKQAEALEARNRALENYNNLKSQLGDDNALTKTAKDMLDNAENAVNATSKEVETTQQAAEKAQEVANQWAKVGNIITESVRMAAEIVGIFGDIAGAIASLSETFNASSEDVEYWQTISDSLNEISSSITSIVDATENGDIMGVISSSINAVPSIISGFVDLFSASKVRKATKEIKKQQKVLDNLAYTYSRLTTLADKLFGADWLNNFDQQKAALNAQLEAYQKQLEAEQSKGKKADDDKIKEYTESIRDLNDQITDLTGQVAEQMTGSDAKTLWQDFASAAWDAYKEFGSVTTAIKEKWVETLQEMAVNSILTKSMEKAMQPVYDMIDNMSESDFYSEDFWRTLTNLAMTSSESAANGANTVLKFLESAGLSMRDVSSELSGSARQIASASEEDINGLAAAINTQNFYISRIDTNTALIAQVVQSWSGGYTSVDSVDLIALQNQHLSYLPTIAANTTEIINRAERAAIAAENIAHTLGKVVKQKGQASNSVVCMQYA